MASEKYFKQRFDAMLNVSYSFVFYFYGKSTKFYNYQFDLAVFILEGDHLTCLYDDKNLKNLGRHIINRVLKNNDYLDKLIHEYGQSLKKFKLILEKIDEINLGSADYLELAELNHELNDKATDIISPSFAEPVSIVLKDYIEDELKNYVHGQADVLRQANDLLETYHNSLLEEEELSRLKILQKIINKKIKLTNIEGDEEILNDIRRHQKNFYWIKNNYKKATELDIDYFIKSIKELSLEDLKKLDFDKTSDIKNKKQKILDPIKSERLNTLSRIADEFAHLHDNRKKWMLIYQAYLWKLLSEFAKRKNLNKEQIGWYTPEELEENIKLDIEQIKNRKKLTVLLYERGKKSLLTGLAARDWKNKLIIENKNIAELKGMVAYPGKVKGTVKVLSSVREIDKLKQGEILVTSNTTPDYVPAMKKAIAFLTEKGGITSHAAIVSREMRKPCIVGINDISDILKDNDEVEVDADNGVVKILRKTEIR